MPFLGAGYFCAFGTGLMVTGVGADSAHFAATAQLGRGVACARHRSTGSAAAIEQSGGHVANQPEDIGAEPL